MHMVRSPLCLELLRIKISRTELSFDDLLNTGENTSCAVCIDAGSHETDGFSLHEKQYNSIIDRNTLNY